MTTLAASQSDHASADGSSHADVASNTTHRGLTSNPHAVTATQVGYEAGRFQTTGGGGATETYTCAGAAVGKAALAVLDTEGTSPVVIIASWASAPDTVSVEFSGDPSSDHYIGIFWEI